MEQQFIRLRRGAALATLPLLLSHASHLGVDICLSDRYTDEQARIQRRERESDEPFNLKLTPISSPSSLEAASTRIVRSAASGRSTHQARVNSQAPFIRARFLILQQFPVILLLRVLLLQQPIQCNIVCRVRYRTRWERVVVGQYRFERLEEG